MNKRELDVGDFDFAGSLGSDGAKMQRFGINHFEVELRSTPGHPDWANNCQFEIRANAAGKRLVLDVRFAHDKPAFGFDEYFHSWSYDGDDWVPIHWVNPGNGKFNRLEFPEFKQDRVYFGLQVPLTVEKLAIIIGEWERHPDVRVHVLGKSLGGLNIYRLEITGRQSSVPFAQRWVHYFKSEHPGEHNAQWRMVGMIDWLLSEAGCDCRQRTVAHFVLLMSPDAVSKGWYRINAQGVDMNRSYRVEGADLNSQAHEAYLCQRDQEILMASEAPVTTAWQMHTWGGIVEPIVNPGPEIGTVLGSRQSFREIMQKNDPGKRVKPLSFEYKHTNPTTWTKGVNEQFGITTVLCEGGGSQYHLEDNTAGGEVLIKSIAGYYCGLRDDFSRTDE